MPGPYIVEQEDAVNMIRHCHKGIERRIREMRGDLEPTRFDRVPDVVQMHLVLFDHTEQTFSISGTGRNEVSSGSRIVVPSKPHALVRRVHTSWFATGSILLFSLRAKIKKRDFEDLLHRDLRLPDERA